MRNRKGFSGAQLALALAGIALILAGITGTLYIIENPPAWAPETKIAKAMTTEEENEGAKALSNIKSHMEGNRPGSNPEVNIQIAPEGCGRNECEWHMTASIINTNNWETMSTSNGCLINGEIKMEMSTKKDIPNR